MYNNFYFSLRREFNIFLAQLIRNAVAQICNIEEALQM